MIKISDYTYNKYNMDLKHRCICGERFMSINFGAYITEDCERQALELISFVNKCSCFKSKK